MPPGGPAPGGMPEGPGGDPMEILAAIAEALAQVTQMIQELAAALGGDEQPQDPMIEGPGGPPPGGMPPQ